MMKRNRVIIQIVVFLLFLFMFFATVYPMKGASPNVFTRMSPLNMMVLAILGKAAGYAIVGSIVVLLLTIVLGRFFCGYVCPMGTTIDASDRALGRPDNPKGGKDFSKLKYAVLTFIIIAAIIGIPAAHYAAPTTLIYRFFTFVVFPPAVMIWAFLQRFIPALSEVKISLVDVSYRGAFLFLLFFGVIFAAGRYYRRFWCRNLCPLGALLSIFSRFSFIQKKVNSKCIDCGKCITGCKMGAIPDKPENFRASECIYCFNCVKVCPVDAIEFKFEKPRQLEELKEVVTGFFKGEKSKDPQTSGFSRRTFMEAAAAGAVVATVAKSDFYEKNPHPRLIRPPAAMPEKDFNDACIRCGECMKACVTGGLQPTFLEAGVEGIMTPRLIPSQGHCEYHCNLCQKVCPTGAIQHFLLDEKKNVKMGTARINRSSCIVWQRGESCLVCDEHCPYKAVYWKDVDGRLCPMVDKDVCVGCGFCENKCPVQPVAAIKVFTQGEKRVLNKDKKGWRSINPLPEVPKSVEYYRRPSGDSGYPGTDKNKGASYP